MDRDIPPSMPADQFRTRVVFTAFVVLGLAALFAAAWWLRTLLLITFLAVLLATVLRALAGRVHGWTGMRARWAVLLIALVLVFATGVATALVAPTLADQTRQLLQRLPQIAETLQQRLNQYAWLASIWQQVSSGLSLPAPADAMGQAGRVVSAISEALGYAGLALVGALFFALQPDLYRRGMIRLVPVRRRPAADDLLSELHAVILSWLGAQLMLMIFIGVVVGLGLWMIGVPYALALGTLAGLLEFIPYLGPILSAAVALSVALGADPTLALWTLGLFLIVQQVENNVLQPLVQESAVEIPPVLLMVMLFGMGQLFGMVGVIVATPLLAVLIVVVRKVYVEGMLEADEPPRPPSPT
ncbi:AI-2E family transporter [Enterovirga sp.]|jgi:predicted PurR-regulated permease PerM|uniref:AI-2E family transporter n=1 Tax=Enterovirga sp. TaxID=2026350 RepID=UPI00262C2E89|nr:AI-2E family transporter [Enterovirga sp.]MDB5589795.1 family transporter [Enterovirga sp.]